MGAVFLARDPDAERDVAIKVITDAGTDQEMRARFLREGRAAARLRHVNIVTVYEVGEFKAQPYIVMEYVDGESLAAVIHQRRSLSLAGKLGLIRQVCDGLHFAHQAGIVHRDVKPANLMVDGTGVVRILDFGIARIEGSGMTRADAMIGTLNYMSPEQMLGLAVDQRSDIFSLGAVAYELLSYRKAFPGSIADGLLHRLPNARPDSLRELCEGLDPEVEAIVWRALEKEPRNRYKALAEMAAHIERVLGRLGERADQPTIVLQRPERATAPPSSPGRGEYVQRRARQLQQHMEAAQAAFDAGDFGAAVTRCEDAATLDPDFRPALTLMDRARAAQARATVTTLIEAARAAFDRGDVDAAIAGCEEALALDPTSVPAIDLVARARARVAHARAQRTLEGAQAALDRGDFDRALALCDDALAIEPDHADAAALAQRARLEVTRRRIRALLRTAQTALDQGDTDRASTICAEAAALEPDFAATRELAELIAAAVKRAAGRRLLDEARDAVQHADLAVAEAKVADAGTVLANAPELAELRAELKRRLASQEKESKVSAKKRQEERERQEKLFAGERLLAAAREALLRGDFTTANAKITDAAALSLESTDVADLQAQLARRLEERERQAQQAAGWQLLAGAREALLHVDLAAAETKLAEAEALIPESPEVAEVRAQLQRRVAERERQTQQAAGFQLLDTAREAMLRGDLTIAGARIADAEALIPESAEIAEVRARLRQREEERERHAAAERERLAVEARERQAAEERQRQAAAERERRAAEEREREAAEERERLAAQERKRQAAAERERRASEEREREAADERERQAENERRRVARLAQQQQQDAAAETQPLSAATAAAPAQPTVVASVAYRRWLALSLAAAAVIALLVVVGRQFTGSGVPGTGQIASRADGPGSGGASPPAQTGPAAAPHTSAPAEPVAQPAQRGRGAANPPAVSRTDIASKPVDVASARGEAARGANPTNRDVASDPAPAAAPAAPPPAVENRGATAPPASVPISTEPPKPAASEPPPIVTPPAPTASAPPPVPMIDRERPAILQALEKYRAAYQHFSADELAAIYPTVGRDTRQGVQRNSSACRAYDVRFGTPEITLNQDGTLAQVIVSSTYVCTPKTRQAPPADSVRDTFQLRRNGAAWIITARGSIDER
jgi:serine/threonine-protein kinase